MRQTLLALAVVTGAGVAIGQDPPAGQPPAQPPAGQPAAAADSKANDLFRSFREAYVEGQYEVAADLLKSFLAANPTDEEMLALENRYGATFALSLRNLAKWSDNPQANAEAKKSVEALVARARTATEKLTRDPKRVKTFVRNLGGSPAEQLYAIDQLRRAGDAAVPALVESLRATSSIPQRTGIMAAITKLGPETVQPFLAAAEALPDDLKEGMVKAVAFRPDVLNLINRTDTDPLPMLWHLAQMPSSTPGITLRDTARTLLEKVTTNFDRRSSADELTRLALPITQKKATFQGTDGATNRVKVWTWDAETNNVKSNDFTVAQAEEYYAVRDLRWAVESDPNYEPAQRLLLGFVAERAVERGRFLPPAVANPAAYNLLTTAPSAMLIDLLDLAIREKRTGLAFGVAHALGDRAERAAVEESVRPGGEPRPGVLVRALDFPDDRVQLAAAVALLKVPTSRPTGANARVVEVLRRALAADPGNTAADVKGKAVVVDPSPLRSARLAGYLRQIGYAVEITSTNRELIRRIHRAADVDLFVIDRHAANPELRDTLVTMTSDASGRKPVLVVASGDQRIDVPVEALILRLGLLVAATETDVIDLPAPAVYDPRKDEEQNRLIRNEIAKERDRILEAVFNIRLGRLKRLVDAADFPQLDADLQTRLDLRLHQLTYAALAAEFPITEASAPLTYKQWQVVTKILARRSELAKTVVGLRTDDLRRLIEQLETTLTPDLVKKLNALRLAVDADALGVPRDTPRDLALEERLTASVRPYKFVTVIPEPLSPEALTYDVSHAIQDPAELPRSPVEKAASAKLAAEWLRALAVGSVPGYDVTPAGSALRTALRSDELGPIVVDAVARLSSPEAQQDLLNAALGGSRQLALRVAAAEATARHVQQFGSFATQAQKTSIAPTAIAEKDPELKGKLAVLYGIYTGTPADFAKAIRLFDARMIDPPAPSKPKYEKAPAPMPEGAVKPGGEAKPDKQ